MAGEISCSAYACSLTVPSNEPSVQMPDESVAREMTRRSGEAEDVCKLNYSDAVLRVPMVTALFRKGSRSDLELHDLGRVPLPPSWCQGVYIE